MGYGEYGQLDKGGQICLVRAMADICFCSEAVFPKNSAHPAGSTFDLPRLTGLQGASVTRARSRLVVPKPLSFQRTMANYGTSRWAKGHRASGHVRCAVANRRNNAGNLARRPWALPWDLNRDAGHSGLKEARTAHTQGP